jgi:hypothetical protein
MNTFFDDYGLSNLKLFTYLFIFTIGCNPHANLQNNYGGVLFPRHLI